MVRRDPPWRPVLVVQVMARQSDSTNFSQTQKSTVCHLRMKREGSGVVALALLLGSVHLDRPCRKTGSSLFCPDVLTNFIPGCTAMVVSISNIGEINSTVLQSTTLSSITFFDSPNCGITKVAANAFSSLLNLQVLILHNNKLSNMNPKWFKNPATIGEVDLSFNQIKDLNKSSLMGLSNLKKLKLNGNMIQTIHPDGFSSQSRLTDLDLSENRLTRLSSQFFTSLKSLTVINLYGNPWNCSCDAQDFVDSLKEFNTSQLVNWMSVTCESPPHLKGQRVLNVSVCSTYPTPGTPSMNQTTPTTKTPAPQQPFGETETTFHPKPTDPPGTSSAHTGTSIRTKLPEATAFSSSTGHYVTSSSDIYPTSTKRHVARPIGLIGPLMSNTKVCTLIIVIVVLCLLLLGVCFMALMHRKNRSNKAVRPGLATEEKEKQHEGDNVSSSDQAAGSSGQRCPEEYQIRSFTGIRAKSANAIILTSPFCVSEKDKVTFQTELEDPSENSGKKTLISESGAEIGKKHHPETVTVVSVEECVTQEGDAGNLYENQEHAHVYTDLIPYLSIGAMQNKPSPDKEPAEGPAQRGKIIRRISTWPPTATQWQNRCKGKGDEEEIDEFAVWTQSATVKPSENVKIMMEHPISSDSYEKEEVTNIDLSISDSFKPPETPFTVLEGEEMIQFGTSEELKSEKQTNSSKADVRKNQKQSATTRQRAENRATAGSKAPSGGASPDDETLLSGNEYAFMDLLHEVVQNNGRWTRERWKNMNVNKQQRR